MLQILCIILLLFADPSLPAVTAASGNVYEMVLQHLTILPILVGMVLLMIQQLAAMLQPVYRMVLHHIAALLIQWLAQMI
jgi:hypothetical protein